MEEDFTTDGEYIGTYGRKEYEQTARNGGFQNRYGDGGPSGRFRGSSIQWDMAAVEALIQSSIFKAPNPNYLDKLRDLANGTSVVDGAEYKSAVHTPKNMHGFDGPPGAYVYTGNYKARVDEANNATLLKVIGQAGTIISKSLPKNRRYSPTPSGLRQIGRNGQYVSGG